MNIWKQIWLNLPSIKNRTFHLFFHHNIEKYLEFVFFKNYIIENVLILHHDSNHVFDDYIYTVCQVVRLCWLVSPRWTCKLYFCIIGCIIRHIHDPHSVSAACAEPIRSIRLPPPASAFKGSSLNNIPPEASVKPPDSQHSLSLSHGAAKGIKQLIQVSSQALIPWIPGSRSISERGFVCLMACLKRLGYICRWPFTAVKSRSNTRVARLDLTNRSRYITGSL